MESDKQHFRHILLFYYRKGKNTVQARKKLTDVYGEGLFKYASARTGSLNFDTAILMSKMHHVREGRLKLIKALVDANRRITTREIGLRLNLSNSTVYDHLKGLGLSSKLDVWVHHVLRENRFSNVTKIIRF
ncbi:histone-lysine N-methyltransferase SETMAR [Trichonephila clavipes]|nr:histone-lysine N-methyltransferase SETMAR [Trichonephila clavipes]